MTTLQSGSGKLPGWLLVTERCSLKEELPSVTKVLLLQLSAGGGGVEGFGAGAVGGLCWAPMPLSGV